MKTTIEVNGYEIVIEEVDGIVSVSALKDGETVEEFSLEGVEGSEEIEGSEEVEGSDDTKSFDEFEEEEDFGDEENLEGEESEEDMEESEEDMEEDMEEEMEEESPAKLESFSSFLSKTKVSKKPANKNKK